MPLPISIFWLNRKPLIVAFILILFFCITGVGIIYSTELFPDPLQSRSILDTLPVVVHVIHTGTPIGAPDNPTDAAINSMMVLLNSTYQKNGPMYGGANVGLAFKLASRAPDCSSTNGITRTDGSIVNHYATGGITSDTNYYPNSAHEVLVKGLNRWPNTDYINIWVVNMIDGDPYGLAGYAYFPENNNVLTDGLVIRADAVNGTNKTIAHEMGHVFYLYHTFGYNWASCEPETDCMTQGDLICDTEPCVFTYDCTATTNSCTGLPWQIVDPDHGYTVLNNYMGYTDCMWMFTEEQKNRILDALNTFRPGLLNSSALQLQAGSVPVPACIPTAVNGLSLYYGIERVIFGDMEVYSNTSDADDAFYVDRTCNQRVVVSVGQTVSISITPSYENYSQVKVYLDFNGDGVFEPPGELILDDSGNIVSGDVTIPSAAVQLCTPLRLRVVADTWAAPPLTPCLLTGTPADGVGQIEDYTVIIKPRLVQTVASGNWNNPAVWSCNCVPSATDALLITSGHTVTVPLALGTVNCASLHLQPTAILNAYGNVHVADGGCD